MKISRKILIILSSILAFGLVVVVVNVTGGKGPKEVVLVTHDSFVMSRELIADFNQSSGYRLKLLKAGDAGSLTNRLILTEAAPIADAVFGIDNTFASLAIDSIATFDSDFDDYRLSSGKALVNVLSGA